MFTYIVCSLLGVSVILNMLNLAGKWSRTSRGEKIGRVMIQIGTVGVLAGIALDFGCQKPIGLIAPSMGIVIVAIGWHISSQAKRRVFEEMGAPRAQDPESGR